MNRVLWCVVAFLGLELIAWGLFIPAHFRAVDAKIIELAGAPTPSLTDEGLVLVKLEKIGPARMLLDAAERLNITGADRLASAIKNSSNSQSGTNPWGGSAPNLERIFEKHPLRFVSPGQPIMDLLLSPEPRAVLLESLSQSRKAGVLEILRTGQLTNTTLFPPPTSSAGQPFEAAVALTALLFQEDYLSPRLRDSVESLAADSNASANPRDLENLYLDFVSLGKRLNWVQMVDLLRRLDDLNTLHDLAVLVRQMDAALPLIYSSAHVSDSPRAAARYLTQFGDTGLKDLTFALRAGTGATRELLMRQKRIHYPTLRNRVVAFRPLAVAFDPLASLTREKNWLGLSLKYGLILIGAILLAQAAVYLSPSLALETMESPRFVTGPQAVMVLCFVATAIVLSEPFLAQPGAKLEFPLRIDFSTARSALRATITNPIKPMIDKLSAVSLVTFFVFQAFIYLFCRMKLAEIKRQPLPSKLKLKLLENEEHLFDAGLYFGFVGTVISLIFVSIGIIKPSLMAAYSSTSFGIIFVSVLKIFNVRPFRRRLILESDMVEREIQEVQAA